MIANDQVRQAARRRVETKQATLEDLRLLSVGPMTEGDYLHARLILTPQESAESAREPYQTSGAEQLAAILAKRGDDGAKFWTHRLQGDDG